MKDDLFNFDESLASGFDTQPKNDYEEKLKKARILCIRGRFEQALAICEEILDEDMENMGAYIEILRVHTEDFTIYEGSEIDKDIHAIERLFPDIDNEEYIDYLQKRRKALKSSTKPQVQEDTDTTPPVVSTETKKQASSTSKTKKQTSTASKPKTVSDDSIMSEDEAVHIVENQAGCTQSKIQKAKDALEMYAQQGSASALLNIGYYYSNGKYGYPQNKTTAFEYYKKAADLGKRNAMYNVGLFYANGTGVRKNKSKSFEYYKKAADLGDSDAMYKIGICYRDGSGVVINTQKAIEYLRKAVQNGNDDAKEPLEKLENPSLTESKALDIIHNASNYTTTQVQEAKKAYEDYATNGSAGALCNIGLYYSMGKYGYIQDKKRAFEYYKKAAAAGSKESMYNLALYYRYGTAGVKDLTKSFEYYKKSADLGDIDAMYETGRCYRDGSGVLKNISKAVEYFKKASQKGNGSAKDALEKLENPPLTESKALDIIQNASNYTTTQVQEAKKAYEDYATNGSAGALCNIGLYYSLGKYGYIQDKKRAFEYYKKAATAGSKESMYNLGIYYQYGNAGVKDLTKSFEYYKKSADLGDIEAMYETGRCYRDGSGVLKNISKAVEYFKKASQKGNQNAKDALKKLGY